MENKTKKDRLPLVTVIVFLSFLFGFAAAFLIVPDNEVSAEENRSLQTFPEFTLERLTDGSFGADMNTYYADQFPFRDTLVGIKGIAELTLGKGENNGVLLGKNGQLAVHSFRAYRNIRESVPSTDRYYSENIENGMKALNKAAASLAEQGIPMTALLVPRTVDVAASAFEYPADDSLNDLIRSLVGENIYSPELLEFFRERYDSGEYVYYRTDHHWTTKGAYYAYEMIMDSFGMSQEVIPAESFTVTDIRDFYGTTYSKAGFKFVSPDTLSLWRLGNENEFVTTDVSNGESFTGFYNEAYLSEKDKYSVFLDGTHNILNVTKKGCEREKILLLKDSFANSVAPFLAQHFDLLIMNLSGSGDETNITKYAEEYGCSRAVVIYNYENMTGSSRLAKVK